MDASTLPSNIPERVPLRVGDYMLLADSGAFERYARTELIDGVIYATNAQFADHAHAKTNLACAIADTLRELGSGFSVLTGVTVRVSDDSAPDPDIVLTTYRGDGIVPVETVVLVIEVADATLDLDLGRKSDLYASAGIPEYWVVDLQERRVLMHEHPSADGYSGQLDALLDLPISSATIPSLDLGVVELLD